MSTKTKPQGLFSRFNKVASWLGGAALSVALLAGCVSSEASTPPKTNATQQDNDLNYEYLGGRTIRLTGVINKATATAVIEKMLELSRKDPNTDIELRINSPGGVVSDGFAIYDVMKSLPNDVRTVCEGEAQSMAAFLLSAGTQGKRFSYQNCEIMYHQPSWGAQGQITDMDVTTAQGNVSKDRMINIIAGDTGLPVKTVRGLLERNFYPSAKEAQAMGFIDHVIKGPKPEVKPAPKTTLPEGFCDNPGRRHMGLCQPE